MKKNFKLILFLTLIVLKIGFPMSAFACAHRGFRCDGLYGDFIVPVGSSNFGDDKHQIMKRQNSEKAVFCLWKGGVAPAISSTYKNGTKVGVNKCNEEYNINTKLKAAIGRVVSKYDQETNTSYGITQQVIHKLLQVHKSDINQKLQPTKDLLTFALNVNGISYEYIYDEANSDYYSYYETNTTGGLLMSGLSYRYDKTTKEYIIYNNGNNNIKIVFPEKAKNYDSHDISAIATLTKNNETSIINLSLTNEEYVYNDSNNYRTYELRIPASDLEGVSNAKVTITYNATRAYKMAQAKICGNDLQPIAESSTDDEYRSYLVSEDVEFSPDSCYAGFKSNMSMKERIKLYNDLGKFYKYKGLLNLNNNDATSACTEVNNGENINNCLSFSSPDNNFNSSDISHYNDTWKDSNGQEYYCYTRFVLSDLRSNKSNNFGIYKSGKIIPLPQTLAQGQLIKTCYLYDLIGDTTLIDNKEYNDYVTSLKFSNYELENTNSNSAIEFKYLDNNLYNGSITSDYNLPEIYSKFGTGEYSDTFCKNCKSLGYGILSKFDDINSKIYINYSLNLNKLFYINKSTNDEVPTSYNVSPSEENKCYYGAEQEIVTTTSEPNVLHVKFRIIDTLHPFPGRNGSETSNRSTNSNWCDGSDCTYNNSVVENNIINSNNSYNKTGDGVLYKNVGKQKIVLTPDRIKEIREYNKSNKYDDYDSLKCETKEDNNMVCTSSFLSKFLNNQPLAE